MDDDLDIDPEMAAAMGFTSFGAKPSKRRKFNHNEAVVEGQDGEMEVIASSGANNTALGVRSRLAPAQAQEMEEGGAEGAEDEENKTKTKESKKQKQKAPKGLADYIAWGNTVTTPSQPPTQPVVQESARSAEAQIAPIAPPTQVAHVPRGGAGAESWPQGMPSGQELATLRRGVQNSRGDMAYFLPSFIEDPWKVLTG